MLTCVSSESSFCVIVFRSCAKAENFRPVFIINLNVSGKGKSVKPTGLCCSLSVVVSIIACCLGIVKELLWY